MKSIKYKNLVWKDGYYIVDKIERKSEIEYPAHEYPLFNLNPGEVSNPEELKNYLEHIKEITEKNKEINFFNSKQETLEGLVLVPFIPTSENFCKWIYDIVQAKMNEVKIKVNRIQFFETPKSESNYYG